MKIKFHDTYPEGYGKNTGKPARGKATCNGVTTLHILAECDGVFRLVQGFTDDKSRDEKAKALFADIIEAGAPVAKVKPEYDSKWSKEIDAVKAIAKVL